MNRKTQAQRDAINARADAYPRPLSTIQRLVLKCIARASLRYTGAGRWGGYAEKTINSLVGRRLCRIEGKQRMRARITPAGRRELARHRGAP